MNRTTRTGLLAAVLAVVTPAQNASTPEAALARAQLLEQQEGDLAQAEQAYRALLAAPEAAAVHRAAALRFGALLWRLERREEARPWLEQAVAAGGDIAAQAQALLQGQGPDAQQEAARRERAKLLITRLGNLLRQRRDEKGNLSEADRISAYRVEQEIDALGATAAEVLAEFLQQNVPLQWADGSPEHYVRALSTAAWRIGHLPAQQVLMGIADTGSVERRVFHAECATRTTVAADMEPVLLRFATAPDPTGEVWPHVASAFGQLNVARLGSLIEHEAVGIRAAALSGLARRWQSTTGSERELVIAQHGETIRAAARSAERRVRDSAWDFVKQCLRNGPAAGTRLFLAEVEHAPDFLLTGNLGWRLIRDDAWLQAAAAAAEQLGAFAVDQVRPYRPQDTLMLLLATYNSSPTATQLTREGAEATVKLLELGYIRDQQWGWARPALAVADDAQVARLLTTAHRHQAWSLLFELLQRPLPISALPTLRRLIDSLLRDATSEVRFDEALRWVRGKQQLVSTKAPAKLLNWAADTRHPDVTIWLGELAAAEPKLAHHCASLLADLADAKVVEALPPLRALLVWEGNEENELNQTERNRIFAALTKAGDVAAIPLFPRAYELGLASGESSVQPVGINCLCEGHGYQEAALRQCWQTLLDSAAAARVFADLERSNTKALVPLPVLDLAIERLIRADSRSVESGLPDRIGSAFEHFSAPLPEASPLLAATRRALGEAEPELAVQLFERLPTALARQLANEGLALLRRADDSRMVYELTSQGIELTIEDWRIALQSESMRENALEYIPAAPNLLGALRSNIEALLRDQDLDIRFEACAAMHRLFGADAVPALLPLLQDQDEAVRQRVRETLNQLRQDAEQRAFWSEAGTGIDLRPQAAASKLLQQAKAGEPKDQRLLAVRSLAILGAAEALPYLIDLTKDQDQELAAAARAAITAIHQRGAVPGATK